MIGKLVNIALVTGGVTATAVYAPGLVKRVTDTARVALTRYELSSVRDALLAEHATSGVEHLVGEPEALGEWLRQNLKSSYGRDTGRDLWGHPYEFDHVVDDFFLVRSLGANGVPDDGCRGTVEVLNVEWERADALLRASAEEEAGPAPRDDDVCLRLQLERGGRASGGGR